MFFIPWGQMCLLALFSIIIILLIGASCYLVWLAPNIFPPYLGGVAILGAIVCGLIAVGVLVCAVRVGASSFVRGVALF